jgi:hypothetical protein
MEKTEEQLRQRAAELEAEAQALRKQAEQIREREKPASPKPEAPLQQAKTDAPDPMTGFYPKKPKRAKWDAHTICSDPDKKAQDTKE